MQPYCHFWKEINYPPPLNDFRIYLQNNLISARYNFLINIKFQLSHGAEAFDFVAYKLKD